MKNLVSSFALAAVLMLPFAGCDTNNSQSSNSDGDRYDSSAVEATREEAREQNNDNDDITGTAGDPAGPNTGTDTLRP